MGKISTDFLESLRAQPQATVPVIIRTARPPAEVAAELTAMGFTVTHTFSLISAVAATAPAHAILDLTEKPWVKSIEPDKPVHTTR